MEFTIDVNQMAREETAAFLRSQGASVNIRRLPRGCGDDFFCCERSGRIISVEEKKWNDLLGSLRINDHGERRLVGQCLAMLQTADVAILYIEGTLRDDNGRCATATRISEWPFGVVQSMLHEIAQAGVIVEQCQTTGRIGKRLLEWYQFYDKDEHTFMQPRVKPQIVSLSPDAPKHMFYMSLPGVGQDLAARLLATYPSMRGMVEAVSREGWKALAKVDGIGAGKAKQIVEFLG